MGTKASFIASLTNPEVSLLKFRAQAPVLEAGFRVWRDGKRVSGENQFVQVPTGTCSMIAGTKKFNSYFLLVIYPPAPTTFEEVVQLIPPREKIGKHRFVVDDKPFELHIARTSMNVVWLKFCVPDHRWQFWRHHFPLSISHSQLIVLSLLSRQRHKSHSCNAAFGNCPVPFLDQHQILD